MNKFIRNTCFLFMILNLIGCSDSEESNQFDEQQKLEVLLMDIIEMADNKTCTDDQNWNFTAYGTKACGGPIGYLIYSTSIDTEEFLNLVAQHAAAQNEFNIKFGIVSDCAVPTRPTGVSCEDGIPTLTY